LFPEDAIVMLPMPKSLAARGPQLVVLSPELAVTSEYQSNWRPRPVHHK
jgi:hypothetical protein